MEEACQHIAGIAEDDLNINVLCCLRNAGHETWCCQIHSDLHEHDTDLPVRPVSMHHGLKHVPTCAASQWISKEHKQIRLRLMG